MIYWPSDQLWMKDQETDQTKKWQNDWLTAWKINVLSENVYPLNLTLCPVRVTHI